MTPLDKTLKRTLKVGGHDYVVTLTPEALKITEKGHRLGLELPWTDLISGQSALAIALQASVGRFQGHTGGALRQAASTSPPARSAARTPAAPKRRTPPGPKQPRRPTPGAGTKRRSR